MPNANFPSDEFKKEIEDKIAYIKSKKMDFCTGPNYTHIPSCTKQSDLIGSENVADDKVALRYAYTLPIKDLRAQQDEDGTELRSENKFVDKVDEIITKITESEVSMNLMLDFPDILHENKMNDLYSLSFDINEPQSKYLAEKDKFLLQKNTQSATNILKIDSYDKNIEENVFIMYYLLSYGVLGFFIYKLLKL